MEAIHWNAKKKYLARPIRKEATNRVLIGMLLSFILLIAPCIQSHSGILTLRSAGCRYSPSGRRVNAGLLGAFFSRLMSVQRQWANMTLDEEFALRMAIHAFCVWRWRVCGSSSIFFRVGNYYRCFFPAFDEVRIEFINVPGKFQWRLYLWPS